MDKSVHTGRPKPSSKGKGRAASLKREQLQELFDARHASDITDLMLSMLPTDDIVSETHARVTGAVSRFDTEADEELARTVSTHFVEIDLFGTDEKPAS